MYNIEDIPKVKEIYTIKDFNEKDNYYEIVLKNNFKCITKVYLKRKGSIIDIHWRTALDLKWQWEEENNYFKVGAESTEASKLLFTSDIIIEGTVIDWDYFMETIDKAKNNRLKEGDK